MKPSVLGFLKGAAVHQLDPEQVDALSRAAIDAHGVSARLGGLLRPVRGVLPHASPELLSELRAQLADALARIDRLTVKR